MGDGDAVDQAALVASYASVAITALGLFGLFTQADIIKGQLDPFYACRGQGNLGPWARFQLKPTTFQIRGRLTPPPLRGPVITGNLNQGLCGQQVVHMTRKPFGWHGRPSWTRVLAIFHPSPLPVPSLPPASDKESNGYDYVDLEKGSATVASKVSPPGLDAVPTRAQNPALSWTGEWAKQEEKRMQISKGNKGNKAKKARKMRDADSRYEFQNMLQREKQACLRISRKAFITLLVTSNAYQCSRYVGDAGVRILYSGYTGAWRVHWPSGGAAVVEYMGLDSHENDTDQEDLGSAAQRRVDTFFPPSIPRRVDKCILMMIGIIYTDPAISDRLGFPDAEESGTSILRFGKRGWPSHGKPTHLYAVMGGNQHKVDCLFHERWHPKGSPSASGEMRPNFPPHTRRPSDDSAMELLIPAPKVDENRKPRSASVMSMSASQGSLPGIWTLWVPLEEQYIVAASIDALPWSYLTWSIHRGMQCILVNYARATMDAYRPALARTLRRVIKSRARELEQRGWSPALLMEKPLESIPEHCRHGDDESTSDMADVAAHSVLKEEGGDNGDSVRTVTDVVRIMCNIPETQGEEQLDRTAFWTSMVGQKPNPHPTESLDADTTVALTKLFVLQWSNELSHYFYEDLPLEMLLA
ncbi:MAG: hypothetical protein M1825_000718 [Sarcosagium campestre]|nr:MAG: hypothetical protein M1825_000718 [Sarcosagium campestre]